MKNEISNQFNMKRWILFFIVIIFILSLIPVFYIAIYNHPSVDDFFNGNLARDTFQETRSVYKTLSTAYDNTLHTYNSWQGSFSSVFLMSLQPTIWSDNLYFLTTFIMLLSFIISSFFFSYELLVKLLKLSKTAWLIIISVIVGVSIQLVPSPVSAFYWYTGSVYYTFFYSLSLFLYGFVIKYILSEKPKTAWIYAVITLPLAFFIGGGNFVTSLITAIILLVTIIYLIVKKNKKSRLLIVIFLITLGAIILASIAPGNAVRQNFYEKSSPVVAIIKSLFYGVIYITRSEWTWIKAPATVVCAVAFIIPFMSEIIRNPKIKFRYPLIALAISFCIFSAQFAPTLYSLSNSGPLRLKNIIFYSYLWFLLFNMTYLTGWIYKRIEKMHSSSKASLFDFQKKSSLVYRKTLLPVLTILFVFAVIFLSKTGLTMTSVSASMSLVNGEAKQYNQENEIRMDLLNSAEPNVKLAPFSVKPYVIYFDDISDPPDWKNTCVEIYFKKESVTLK